MIVCRKDAGVAPGGSAQCPRRTRFRQVRNRTVLGARPLPRSHRQWTQAAGMNDVALGANAAVSEWPPPRVASASSAVVARRLRERGLLWRTGASLRRGRHRAWRQRLRWWRPGRLKAKSPLVATRRLLSKPLRLGKESPLASEGSRPAPREPAATAYGPEDGKAQRKAPDNQQEKSLRLCASASKTHKSVRFPR